MSIITQNIFRTFTTSSEVSTPVHRSASCLETSVSSDNSANWPTYYPLGQISYTVVENLWSCIEPGSRFSSLNFPEGTDFEPRTVMYPVMRTVSNQARDNVTDDLSLDEMDRDIYSPGYVRCLSEVSTASDESPRIHTPVRKILVVPTEKKMHVQKKTRVQLGEFGRQRLKSIISAMTKMDYELKRKVFSIGRIKFASTSQLMEMAKICGIYDETEGFTMPSL